MATGLLGVFAMAIGPLVLSGTAIAATGINHTINFQGKVTNANGTNVSNGSYTFVFKLYSVSSAGSAIWTESKSLTVTDGVFQTNLGDVTSLPGSVDFNTDNIYLGMAFNSDPEMSPRIQFTASPYAFNSEKLGGLTASQFGQLNPSSAQSGSLNVTGTVQAGTSLQAPVVDTATGVGLAIGGTNATSVTVGKASASVPLTLQGSASSTWAVTGASGSTTIAFAAPTTTNTITFPNAGGTVCTTVATTCNTTYQAAGNYLAKNAADTSSASFVGALLGLTNTSIGAGNVLSLTNAGTSAALVVTQSGNASAGQALILANNTNGTPSGNLLDLQVGGVSKFSVSVAGAVTTASTINNQTISSAANFTGSVTVATNLTVNGNNNVITTSTDSSTAFKVVNSGGKTVLGVETNNNLVRVDTGSITNTDLTSGTGALQIGADNTDNLALDDNEIQARSNGATNLLFLQKSGGSLVVGSNSQLSSARLSVFGNANGNGLVVRSSATSPGNALELQDSSGNINSAFNGTGNQLTLGRAAASGTVTAGQLLFADGTTDNFTTTLKVGTTPLTANRTISFGDQAGTICVQTSTACGFVTGANTDFIQNQNTAAQTTSNYWISGSGRADTSFIAPLLQSANTTTSNSADITLRSGNTTAGSGLSTGAVTIKSGDGTGTNTSTGNVGIDAGAKSGSGFAGNINIGAANALNVNIGRNSSSATVGVSIQGTASATNIIVSNSANTFQTTLAFATPTATATITVPTVGANATLCTSDATTSANCATSYIQNQTGSAQTGGFYVNGTGRTGGNMTVGGALFTGSTQRIDSSGNLSNIGTISATGAVSITGTGANELAVSGAPNTGVGAATSSLVQLGSAIASGSANGTYLGINQPNGATSDFVNFQVNGVSKLSINSAGSVAQASGATINSQTISATANFTGTLTVASAFTVSTGGASISGGLNNNSGNITNAGNISGAGTITGTGTITGGGTFKSADGTTSSAVSLTSGNASAGASGAVSIDSGTATTTAGAITVGAANASAITIGRNGTGSPDVKIQGGSGSQIQVNNGTNYSLIQFTAPTAQVTYTLGTNGSNTSAAICTSIAASCNTTYQAYSATGYILKNATDTSTASVAGTLLTLSNSNGGAAGVLALNNSGTSSALTVAATSNPTSGQALLLINNNTATTQTGTLLDLQKAGVSSYKVDIDGNVTTTATSTTGRFNSQIISASGSTFTNSLTVQTGGLTVSAGGLTVTGTGLFNNALTATGAFTANGGASISTGLNNNAGGITNAGAVSGLSSLQFNTAGTIDANAAVSLSIGTTNASAVTVGRAGGTLSLQGNTSTSLVASNGTNTITARFQNPTANVIYEFGNATGGTYQLCSTYATTCNTTYAAYYASGYIQMAPAAAQTDGSTNSSIFINKTATGNLLNLQASASTVFQVQTNGNMTSTGLATLGNGVMTVDPSTFKVKVGSGTPTLGNGASNATAALYVSGTTELANLVKIGDNTNNASFDGTTKELSFTGTARHSKAIRLTAEYAGAVLDADGTTNTGTMTAGLDQSQNPDMAYYKWTTGQAATQDYDIVASMPIPDDFAAWTSTPSFMTYGSGTGSAITATVYDTTGTVSNVNGTALTVSTTWTARTTSLLTGTYTQGSTMVIRLHMSAGTSADTRVGTITIPYLSRW